MRSGAGGVPLSEGLRSHSGFRGSDTSPSSKELLVGELLQEENPCLHMWGWEMIIAVIEWLSISWIRREQEELPGER